jgi:serine/threonine protein kinase/tetratricopeptide (TPR) repeat protein
MTPGRAVLGPFLLDQIIGRGGMAVVWRAHHRGDGTPVALKVLHPEVAAEALFAEAFRFEVMSAAGLDHPRITAVYDTGQVTDAEALRGLPVGVPWLAMELVDGSSAGPLCGNVPWRGLRGVLLGTLDGLAHAHARGVVHRDIKPGNVLIDRADRRVKLTDFGLAHSIRGDETGPMDEDFHGTPEYMAPEQIECRWRDFGPWTDMYAVGAMAWALATGEPPYAGEMKDVLFGHMAGYLPAFEPKQPVPEGFLGWIQTMMASPARRFGRAADASWALVHLGEPDQEPSEDLTQSFYSVDPAAPKEPSTSKRSWWRFGRGAKAEEEDEDEDVDLEARIELPPMPASWRGPKATRRHLNGAGLALYSQRAHGLVGRAAERDQLWGALHAVRNEHRPRLLILEGPTGTGKSALANWFMERAEEVGAAQVLMATHTEAAGPADGLVPLLATHLRIRGLDRGAAVERVTRALVRLGVPEEEREAAALTQLATPFGDDERTVPGLGATFSGPQERHSLLARYLGHLAAVRPLILWLDDLHLGPDTQGFVTHLLMSASAAPILVIGAVRTEALAAQSALADAMDTLLDRPRTERLELAPLDREEASALVRDLLGLEPELAAQVEDRSSGNPLFAVQLVGDWVARGLLENGERGFRLIPGVDAGFPESLLEIWEGRLEQILDGRTEEETDALELAAVLGQSVDPFEWQDACYLAELEVPHPLVDELLRLRLAEQTGVPDGWSFVHGMLREALERRADRGGRRILWASIAADALEHRPEAVRRRARHLLAANRTDETPGPLARAVDAELKQGEFARAAEMQELYVAALDRLGVPYDDPRRVFGSVLMARVLGRTGEIEASHAVAGEALAQAREADSLEILVEALSTAGNAAVAAGHLDDARDLLEEGIELALDEQFPARAGAMSNNLSFVHMRQGRHFEGIDAARESIYAGEAAGDPHAVAQGYGQLARCTWQSGDLVTAEFLLNEARLRYERMGARWGLATTTNTLGELLRARGDLAGAEAAYREAAERYTACGSGDVIFPRLNVAVTQAQRGQPKRALQQFDALAEDLARAGRTGILAAVHALRLLPLSELGRWDRFDEDLAQAELRLEQTGLVDLDVARFTQLAGEVCIRIGDRTRACRVFTLSRDQWTAMGRFDAAAELEQYLP